MAGVIVGSVGVEVYPDTSGFWRRFQAGTQAGAQAEAEKLARTLTQRLPQALQDAIARGLSNPVATRVQGRQSGAAYADAFATEVKAKLAAAARALGPRVNVDANTDPAVAEVEMLRRRIRETDAHLRIGRIDDDQAVAQINAITARLQVLARESPNVRVRVNTGAAVAELAALQTALQAVDESVDDIGRSSDRSMSRLARLGATLAVIGPAAIPLAATAVPAMIALGAGAGVAALAVYGLAKNIDAASTAAVNSNLNILKRDLDDLAGVAARSATPELLNGMVQLHQLAPQLRGDVSLIAAQLAEIATNTGVGVVRIFQAAAPLTDRILNGVVGLSRGFSTFGGSPEFLRFLDYAEAKLPEVRDFLIQFGTAIAHIAEAAAPWGSLVLGAFTSASEAINAIPMPVLTQLVTMFELLMTYRLLSGVFTSIGNAAGAMAIRFAAARTAGYGMAASMAATVGPMILMTGLAAGAAYGLTHMTVKLADASKNFGDLTSAIREDGGVLGDHTREAIASAAQTNGLADAARKAGFSVGDLAAAVGGTDEQWADFARNLTTNTDLSFEQTAALLEMRSGFVHDKEAADDLSKSFDQQNFVGEKLGSTYKQLSTQLGISQDHLKQYAKDLGVTDSSSAAFADSITGLAKTYATANTAQTALLDATIAYGNSAGTAADQAKYLGQVLVSSQGDTLGVASAFANAYGAVQNFKDQVKGDSALQQGLVQMANKLDGVNLATADLSTYTDVFSSSAAPAVTQALSGIQQQGQAAAEAWYQHQVGIEGAQQASQDAASVFQTTTHDALYKLLGDLGLNNEQAGALADNLFSMDNKSFQSDIFVQGLQTATDAIQTLALTMANLNGKQYTSYYSLQIGYTAGQQQFVDERNALFGQFNGGIVKSFAKGGFNTSLAQIVPDGSNILFAEEGTGGEAFIPMGGSHRVRSTQILGAVADDFGYALVPVNAAPRVVSNGNGRGGVNIEHLEVNEVTDAFGTGMAVARQIAMISG